MKIKYFFNNHPVFRYEEFRAFMKNNGANKDSSIRQVLSYYHKQGKINSIQRLLYAVNPDTVLDEQEIDPYLIAAKATQSAILAYHTALEIHNIAYTTFEELTYLEPVPFPSVFNSAPTTNH
jgi:predicted transcriptional regulator of viral defense system